jgi:hypothetical protein
MGVVIVMFMAFELSQVLLDRFKKPFGGAQPG